MCPCKLNLQMSLIEQEWDATHSQILCFDRRDKYFLKLYLFLFHLITIISFQCGMPVTIFFLNHANWSTHFYSCICIKQAHFDAN